MRSRNKISSKRPRKGKTQPVTIAPDIGNIIEKLSARKVATPQSHEEALLLAQAMEVLLKQIHASQFAFLADEHGYVPNEAMVVVLRILWNTVIQAMTRALRFPELSKTPDPTDPRLYDLAVRHEMTRALALGWRAPHLAFALGVDQATANEIIAWTHYRDPKLFREMPWCFALQVWLSTNEPTQPPWKVRGDEQGREAMKAAMWAAHAAGLDPIVRLPPK